MQRNKPSPIRAGEIQAPTAATQPQSAASHAIAALEARHDTKLFNRIGRRIELTEAGHVFLAEARAVLARAEAAELALTEFGALKRGTLSIQASTVAAKVCNTLEPHCSSDRQRRSSQLLPAGRNDPSREGEERRFWHAQPTGPADWKVRYSPRADDR
jgi:DNA-binding transcriptional LysR family regulator